MQTYKELIGGGIYNGLSGRECLEWSNFWYDCTDKETDKRWLLVGDSTARMVRSTMASELNIPVDLFGSSSAIDDELFVNQIDAFFRNSLYRYNCIIIQLGHHSRIGKDGKDYCDRDYDKFKHDLQLLVTYLRQYCSNVVLMTVFHSVIPLKGRFLNFLNRLHILNEKPDVSVNFIKNKKNIIIKDVATTLNVPFIDINAYMESTSFRHVDHIHYENKAKVVILNSATL